MTTNTTSQQSLDTLNAKIQATLSDRVILEAAHALERGLQGVPTVRDGVPGQPIRAAGPIPSPARRRSTAS